MIEGKLETVVRIAEQALRQWKMHYEDANEGDIMTDKILEAECYRDCQRRLAEVK